MAMDPTSSARFTTADLVAAGIAQDDPKTIRWFSQHMYQYSCVPSPPPVQMRRREADRLYPLARPTGRVTRSATPSSPT